MVVSVTGDNAVTASVCQQNGLDCHVGTKHNLGNVVKEFDWVRVNRITLFHHARTDDNKQEIRDGNTNCRREVGQRPSLQ